MADPTAAGAAGEAAMLLCVIGRAAVTGLASLTASDSASMVASREAPREALTEPEVQP
jgi:hypothetical protein